MIRLITGLPGAGKTLRGVEVIRKFLAEGRAVYVDGIDGLQPFGWEPCNAREWEKLPDGSVVVVDEAQKIWPTRRMGDAPPDIKALSEHRHHGLDFVLMTQHPTMLDKYVRTLVGQHEHVLRQFGAQASRIITWTEAHDDPQSTATRSRGTEMLWRYPKDCYPLYKSATLHTVKRKLPFRLAIMPVLLVLVVGLGWWGWSAINAMASVDPVAMATNGAMTGESTQSGRSRSRASADAPKYADAGEYAEAFTPRIAAMPWSAPAFDDAPVVAKPEMLCVISEVKGCQCYTEQVTRVKVPMLDCYRVARDGVYNPFREPIQERQQRDAYGAKARDEVPVASYESLPAPARTPDSLARKPLNAGSVWPVR